MAKLMTLFRTAPAVDPAAFRDYWANAYLNDILVSSTLAPAIRRVVHNHGTNLQIRDEPQFAPADWAGISEIWFDSRSDAEAFQAHPELREINDAHADTLVESTSMLCHEVPIWDDGLERPSLKLIAFFHGAGSMTRQESQRYWNEEHVRIGGALINPGQYAARYVQNHAYLDYHAGTPEYDFTGAPELWFKSADAAQRMFGESTNIAELAEDEAKFSIPSKTVSFVTDEHEMFVRGPRMAPAA